MNKKIAFTICSNNYLAQAKTLGDSLKSTNKDYIFFIFLVDKKDSQIDYAFFHPYKIVPIEDLTIRDFNKMYKNYNITELNTAVKPFIFEYLFEKYSNVKNVLYFDPDIMIFGKLQSIENNLKKYNIVLTPHITVPIPLDGYTPSERSFNNYGLYNLGFLALSRSNETTKCLSWWKERLQEHCIIDLKKGYFVDQIWANFFPIFFKKVKINSNSGLNMAYWNLHERTLSEKNGVFFVNKTKPLIFYHFSGYELTKPNQISKYSDRYEIENRKDLEKIHKIYYNKLMKNKYDSFKKINCYYENKRSIYSKGKTIKRQKKQWLIKTFKKISKLFSKKQS